MGVARHLPRAVVTTFAQIELGGAEGRWSYGNDGSLI
jgi:hypothetical protein